MQDNAAHETVDKLTPGKSSVLLRFEAIGTVLLCATGTFAYTSDWILPGPTSLGRTMAAFHEAKESHASFRRNRAKGMCIGNWFESNGQATALFKAVVFKPGRMPVIGPFALAREMSLQTDAPAGARSLALRFLPPDVEEWRNGISNIPVFTSNSAQDFHGQLLVSTPDPAIAKPDPAKMKLFLASPR